MADPPSLSVPLSDEEIEELDTFLLSAALSDNAMTLDRVDGFLTAIAVGPTAIMPSQWLPKIWGPTEEDSPEYESAAQAKRIVELLVRHMNGLSWTFQNDPDGFDPLLSTMKYENDDSEYFDGEGWASGFIDGMELCLEDWEPLFDDAAGKKAFRPIELLGGCELTEEQEKLIRWPNQREELTNQIAASVGYIYRFWLPHRKALYARPTRRAEAKTVRNALCPCGSGKKFNRCCGSSKNTLQ